ncbi:hypothetical protein K461DRAFT_154994 [Myriangium duriaei CBS 260.36]|uniref:Uncharacterized protein n=1 Tax=Myriangium duriaei CBS 260.36 TaxID=1168546 RepID=A0A9P4IZA1_9PEZI|nr:hypothetical protein K461DRAFT_154994 [Myriangium duriaei CBS 260.36]
MCFLHYSYYSQCQHCHLDFICHCSRNTAVALSRDGGLSLVTDDDGKYRQVDNSYSGRIDAFYPASSATPHQTTHLSSNNLSSHHSPQASSINSSLFIAASQLPPDIERTTEHPRLRIIVAPEKSVTLPSSGRTSHRRGTSQAPDDTSAESDTSTAPAMALDTSQSSVDVMRSSYMSSDTVQSQSDALPAWSGDTAARMDFLEAGMHMLQQQFQRLRLDSPKSTANENQAPPSETPAQQLLRLHEAYDQPIAPVTACELKASNAGEHQFPALAVSKNTPRPQTIPSPRRRRSYASVLHDSEGQARLSALHKHAEDSSKTSVQNHLAASLSERKAREKIAVRTTVAGSRSPTKSASTIQGHNSSQLPQSQTVNPRLAQATSPKNPITPAKSPTKVTRARSPVFATQKRSADRHRRASLPSAWTESHAAVKSEPPAYIMHSPVRTSAKISVARIKSPAKPATPQRKDTVPLRTGTFATPTLSSRQRATPQVQPESLRSETAPPHTQSFHRSIVAHAKINDVRELAGEPTLLAETNRPFVSAATPLERTTMGAANTSYPMNYANHHEPLVREVDPIDVPSDRHGVSGKGLRCSEPLQGPSRIPRLYAQAHLPDTKRKHPPAPIVVDRAADFAHHTIFSSFVADDNHSQTSKQCRSEISVSSIVGETDSDTFSPTPTHEVKMAKTRSSDSTETSSPSRHTSPSRTTLSSHTATSASQHEWTINPGTRNFVNKALPLENPADQRTISQATLIRSSLRADAPDFVPTFAHGEAETDKGKSNQDEQSDSLEAVTQQVTHGTMVLNPADYIPDHVWAQLNTSERRAILDQRGPPETWTRKSRSNNKSGFSPASQTRDCQSRFNAVETFYIDPQGNVVYPNNRSGGTRFANDSRLKLGRAPAPDMAKPENYGWTIGSSQPRWWYGWRGGDGKEIAFTGYGPDAEKDPNSPVNFRGGPSSQIGANWNNVRSHTGSRDERSFHGSPLPTCGCGVYDVVQAAEEIGVSGSMVGWCRNCMQ